MDRRLHELLSSIAAITVAVLVLWPPVDALQWWTLLPERFQGDFVLLGLFFGLGTLAGVIITAFAGIRPRYLLAGGTVAYVGAMVTIEVLFTPESPVHLLLYAVILVSILCGGLVGSVLSGDEEDSAVAGDSA